MQGTQESQAKENRNDQSQASQRKAEMQKL